MMRRITLVLILSLCLSSAVIPVERASAAGVGDLSNALQEAITQVRPAAEQAIASVANLFQQLVTSLQPILTSAIQGIMAAVNNFSANAAGAPPRGVDAANGDAISPPPSASTPSQKFAPPKEAPPADPAGDADATAKTQDGSAGKFNQQGVLDVPLVGQPDGYTCGPTSLCMALKYYGVHKSIHPELCNLCGTTTNGTNSTVDVANAAKRAGLAGSYSKTGGSIDWLRSVTQSGKPVVVNVCGGVWTGGHYILVTGVKDGKVFINDPANGLHGGLGPGGNRYTLDFNTFSSIWATRSNNAAVISH